MSTEGGSWVDIYRKLEAVMSIEGGTCVDIYSKFEVIIYTEEVVGLRCNVS